MFWAYLGFLCLGTGISLFPRSSQGINFPLRCPHPLVPLLINIEVHPGYPGSDSVSSSSSKAALSSPVLITEPECPHYQGPVKDYISFGPWVQIIFFEFPHVYSQSQYLPSFPPVTRDTFCFKQPRNQLSQRYHLGNFVYNGLRPVLKPPWVTYWFLVSCSDRKENQD